MIVSSHRYRSIEAESRKTRFLIPDAPVYARRTVGHDILIFVRRIYVTGWLRLLPFMYWIKQYSWTHYLLSDIIAGLTVSVILVPQGLAYAQLADCPPVVGLYMGVFPIIVFAFFTTSKHVAYGPMALICLMTDRVISTVQTKEDVTNISRIAVGTAVTFTTSLWLLLGFLLRLGFICSLMSKTFISAFTTGVSVHVFNSQLKEVLGISLGKYNDYFGIVKLYMEVGARIKETNLISLGIALVTIAITEVVGYFAKPIQIKKIQFTIPLEFILMVVGGVISYFVELNKRYNVKIVGDVPMGFPIPSVPPLKLVYSVAGGSFVIAIVAYFLTLSVAFYFSSLKKYKVDPNQEFFAKGLSNLFSSFFSCLPCSASISRSTIQARAGGETQIASLAAAVIIIFVLFLIARVLTPIPRSLLAGIIVCSVISVFRNSVKDLAFMWSVSPNEIIHWTLIVLVVIFLNIDVGLAFGLLMSLVSSVVHGSNPVMYLMGRVFARDGSNYVYTRLRQELGNELPGIKIVRINGPVSFISRDHVQKRIQELVGVNPKEVTKVLLESTRDDDDQYLVVDELTKVDFKQGNPNPEDHTVIDVTRSRLHYIVLDTTFSRFVDYSGLQCLCALASAYDALGVGVVVVATDSHLSPLRDVDSAVRQLEAALPRKDEARSPV